MSTKFRPEEILDFWWGKDPENPLAHQERWWKKDPNFDEEVRGRFAAYLAAADRGEFQDWSSTPEGLLALVILLDQFPRNIFRGRPESFAFDGRALQLCLKAQESGTDLLLAPGQRWFLYMPMMHAEDRGIQRRSVAAFQKLAHEGPAGLREALEGAHEFAVKHAQIVERFGRFPHRNAILGRPSTPEETEFLKQPGSSF